LPDFAASAIAALKEGWSGDELLCSSRFNLALRGGLDAAFDLDTGNATTSAEAAERLDGIGHSPVV
jgi:hypothetical protein